MLVEKYMPFDDLWKVISKPIEQRFEAETFAKEYSEIMGCATRIKDDIDHWYCCGNEFNCNFDEWINTPLEKDEKE